MTGRARWVFALVPLALAACDNADGEKAGGVPIQTLAEPSGETLAAMIAQDDAHAPIAAALDQTGLNTVFDGPGAYTLLAGAAGLPATADDAGRRALVAATLRNHILPGSVTRDAIEKAIADTNGAVTMRTLGSATLRFSRDGDTLLVTNSETGRSARITGPGRQATNGVLLPIDRMLSAPVTEPATNAPAAQ